MDFLPTLILFLLTFTVIIAVHEFGHYLTARLLGMKVLEFAFGFPPRIAARSPERAVSSTAARHG